MRFRQIAILVPAVMILTLHVALADSNWPHWRGPLTNGVSDVVDPPVTWSRTDEKKENILWQLPLPGPAGATPVVWGDRIFLTSVGEDGKDLLLLCADTSG